MEQPPSPPEETPQEQPAAEARGAVGAAASQGGGAGAEGLDEQGAALLQTLRQVGAPNVVDAGGGGGIPWIEVRPEHLEQVAQRCRDHEEMQTQVLHCLLAVDYVESIQVVYILMSVTKHHMAMLKVNVPADAPKVPTMVGLWEGAAWYEREAHDLYGVEFEGNPDLSPLLLYEGFEGNPGLKSFPFHDYEEY